MLGADTLVVSQKAKLVELTNQYEIHGSDGATLGYVEQERQSRTRKVLRFVTAVDQFLTHRLSVYDAAHTKVLELTRPAKLIKSRLTVNDGHGWRVGEIVQQKFVGVMKAVFTTADNYVVSLDARLDGDLRLLVTAAAAVVDTALKQDPRGIDIGDLADFT